VAKNEKGLFDDSEHFHVELYEEGLPAELTAALARARQSPSAKGKVPLIQVHDKEHSKYFLVIPRADLVRALRQFEKENSVEATLLKFAKR